MTFELHKSDLEKIGHDIISNYGEVLFICGKDTANMEGYLLQHLLKLFGDYEIVDSDESHSEFDGDEVFYYTNLPTECFNKEFDTELMEMDDEEDEGVEYSIR